MKFRFQYNTAYNMINNTLYTSNTTNSKHSVIYTRSTVQNLINLIPESMRNEFLGLINEVLLLLMFIMVSYLTGRKLPKTLISLRKRTSRKKDDDEVDINIQNLREKHPNHSLFRKQTKISEEVD